MLSRNCPLPAHRFRPRCGGPVELNEIKGLPVVGVAVIVRRGLAAS